MTLERIEALLSDSEGGNHSTCSGWRATRCCTEFDPALWQRLRARSPLLAGLRWETLHA